MGTWTALYVKTNNLSQVIDKLQTLTGYPVTTSSIFPTDFNSSYILDESPAFYFIAGSSQPEWVTVSYNSFDKLQDWCTVFSQELNTEVIVTIFQTTSDYYYFSLYEKGKLRREIEVCYSEDFDSIDYGDKFSFENEHPGEKYDFDDETSYIFDSGSLEKYCHYFNLSYIPEDNIEWTILKGNKSGKTLDEFLNIYKKPWWKFW